MTVISLPVDSARMRALAASNSTTLVFGAAGLSLVPMKALSSSIPMCLTFWNAAESSMAPSCLMALTIAQASLYSVGIGGRPGPPG